MHPRTCYRAGETKAGEATCLIRKCRIAAAAMREVTIPTGRVSVAREDLVTGLGSRWKGLWVAKTFFVFVAVLLNWYKV